MWRNVSKKVGRVSKKWVMVSKTWEKVPKGGGVNIPSIKLYKTSF